jgi:hypothetical protein
MRIHTTLLSQENIGHPHITQSEVRGLKAIVLYLHSLPVNKKGVPAYIKDPVSLVRDIRIIVEVHKNDRPERAVNGRPLLFWPGIKQESSWFMKGKRTAEVDREPASRVEDDGKMYLSKKFFYRFTYLTASFIEIQEKNMGYSCFDQIICGSKFFFPSLNPRKNMRYSHFDQIICGSNFFFLH